MQASAQARGCNTAVLVNAAEGDPGSAKDKSLLLRSPHLVLEGAMLAARELRAKLAAEVLESLEDADEGVEAAWASEIEARVAAARAGDLEGTDWRSVLDRLEREVLGR